MRGRTQGEKKGRRGEGEEIGRHPPLLVRVTQAEEVSLFWRTLSHILMRDGEKEGRGRGGGGRCIHPFSSSAALLLRAQQRKPHSQRRSSLHLSLAGRVGKKREEGKKKEKEKEKKLPHCAVGHST